MHGNLDYSTGIVPQQDMHRRMAIPKYPGIDICRQTADRFGVFASHRATIGDSHEALEHIRIVYVNEALDNSAKHTDAMRK